MKHILLITDMWVPQVSGVVTTLKKTKELLELRGYRVSVIHPFLFSHISAPLYPELKVPFVSRVTLERMITDINPDAIHIVTEGALGLQARRACLKLKLNFTTSYHTHFPLYVKEWLSILSRPTLAYIRWFHSASARVLVSTPALKAALEKQHIKNIVVSPFGIDTALFTPPIERSKNAEPLFVYCGRIAREKNVEEFLEADLPGTKLVIGGGAQKEMLEKKYPKVQFVGYKFGAELAALLGQADVFVFPSRTDTFGMVVLEALACGTPVAAHAVMGPADIIADGVDGVLDDDLAAAAIKCLTVSRGACRAKALHYSWDASVDTFIANLVPTITH